VINDKLLEQHFSIIRYYIIAMLLQHRYTIFKQVSLVIYCIAMNVGKRKILYN